MTQAAEWAEAAEQQLLDETLKLAPVHGWTWKTAELAGKADVKAHAREMASHAKSKALFEANEAKVRLQHTAEEAANRGFTRPVAAIGAVGALGAAALAVYMIMYRQRAKQQHHWMCPKHWTR